MTALFQCVLKSAKWVVISFQLGIGETVICHLSPLLLHREFNPKHLQ